MTVEKELDHICEACFSPVWTFDVDFSRISFYFFSIYTCIYKNKYMNMLLCNKASTHSVLSDIAHNNHDDFCVVDPQLLMMCVRICVCIYLIVCIYVVVAIRFACYNNFHVPIGAHMFV